jgi:hypothetical protein
MSVVRLGCLALLAALTLTAAPALGHAPGTAIGRAVTALRVGQLSYDPGSPLSEIDSGAIERRLRSARAIAVALMPAAALQEVTGGPSRLALEVARESARTGTVVVLAGRRLGAWSDAMPLDRLGELVNAVEDAHRADGSVVALLDLVGRIGAEAKPSSGGSSAAWWIAGGGGAALLVAATLVLRRRATPDAAPVED